MNFLEYIFLMSLELPKSAFQSILDCIDMINSLWKIPTEKTGKFYQLIKTNPCKYQTIPCKTNIYTEQ